MTTPDWKDAPEWANYVAMDADGYWYWHEYEPEALETLWVGGGIVARTCAPIGPTWRDTLSERPE